VSGESVMCYDLFLDTNEERRGLGRSLESDGRSSACFFFVHPFVFSFLLHFCNASSEANMFGWGMAWTGVFCSHGRARGSYGFSSRRYISCHILNDT
jgi:hypothetical protein